MDAYQFEAELLDYETSLQICYRLKSASNILQPILQLVPSVDFMRWIKEVCYATLRYGKAQLVFLWVVCQMDLQLQVHGVCSQDSWLVEERPQLLFEGVEMFGDAEGGSAGEKSFLWLKLSILTHYKFYNSNNFTSSHHTVGFSVGSTAQHPYKCSLVCYLDLLVVYVSFQNSHFIIIPPMAQSSNQSEQTFTLFLHAVKSGSIPQVEDILRTVDSSIVNRIEPQFRQPSLYFASLVQGDSRSAELIKLLIRNGANYKFRDSNEQTILFYICRQGKEQCAQILLSHGLSLDDTDIYGQTPMFYAVSQNRFEIVRKYSTKERVNHQDKLAGQTPLYYVKHLDMARLLIEKGADVTITDSQGKTAVQQIRKLKLTEIVEYLASQLKKAKEFGKSSSSVEQSERKTQRKKDQSKQAKQTFKIVFLNENGEARDLTFQEIKQLMLERPQLQKYITNPESIPEESLNVESESWQKVVQKILAHCMKLKGAYYFTQPVDPVKYNIMDYFDIVSKPMDLGTIKKKLSHNCYANASQFVEDMRLVWNNCYKYNGEQHIVSKCAKELQNSFEECLSTMGLQQFLVADS